MSAATITEQEARALRERALVAEREAAQLRAAVSELLEHVRR